MFRALESGTCYSQDGLDLREMNENGPACAVASGLYLIAIDTFVSLMTSYPSR